MIRLTFFVFVIPADFPPQDEDGNYHAPAVAKVAYGTMILIRADIVAGAARHLQRAATIAVRYALVRRQSHARPGDGRERQVNTSLLIPG